MNFASSKEVSNQDVNRVLATHHPRALGVRYRLNNIASPFVESQIVRQMGIQPSFDRLLE
jgi:hypothetical protein